MNNSKVKDIIDHFEKSLSNQFKEEEITHLRKTYHQYAMVPLRRFMTQPLLCAIKEDANKMLLEHGHKRNLKLAITDNTARSMITVGQPVIERESNVIKSLYLSEVLLSFVSDIVGEKVFQCPYLGERYVISCMEEHGDTHGWHWDDYTLAIVWILESPDSKSGGFVQCVPKTKWNKSDPDVYGAIVTNPIYSYAFEAGDAYLLKANTTMHRVHPIRDNSRRLVINTTWATADDLKKSISHETNDILFGGETGYAAV